MNIIKTLTVALAGILIIMTPAMIAAYFVITRDPVNMMGGWGPIIYITALAFGLGIMALADRFLNRS